MPEIDKQTETAQCQLLLRQPLSRRRVVASELALAAGAALVACGDDGTTIAIDPLS